MFGIVRAATVAAPDANAAIDLKAFAAIGINQFDRPGPLPGNGVAAGILVNPRRAIEQILQIHHDRIGWNRLQIVDDGPAIDRIGDHLWIHAIIINLPAADIFSLRRPARSRRRFIWLSDHIVEEDVGLGIDVRWIEAGLEARRSQHRSVSDQQRAGVTKTIGQCRHAAVERVANSRSRSGRGDRQ